MNHNIISAIYSTMLSTEHFDDIHQELGDVLFGLDGSDAATISGLVSNKEIMDGCRIDPNLLAQLQRVQNLQQRLGRGNQGASRLQILLDAASNPTFVFDRTGAVLATNGLARLPNKMMPKLMEEFCTDLDALSRINKFCQTNQNSQLLVIPNYFSPENNDNKCVLVRKLNSNEFSELVTSEDDQDDRYLYTQTDFEFDPQNTKLFCENFKLTKAEVEVLLGLSRGAQPTQIAITRDTSIETVRTQIKSIKRKTNTSDIAASVRLFCGFSAGLLSSKQFSKANLGVSKSHLALERKKSFKLRDGRMLHYLEQGALEGEAVLMFHNLPYGILMQQEAALGAKRMGLRIITPYRPGYGGSELIQGVRGSKLLDSVATDYNELLGHLQLPKAIVVSQSVGGAFALRFATLFPHRVKKLLAISRVPIWRKEWEMQMPERQRFIMRIAKYFPQLLPIIIRALVNYVDSGKVKKLIVDLAKPSPIDAAILKSRPDLLDLIATDCVEGLRQGFEAFCNDCLVSVQDSTNEAQLSPHKFHILHGKEDEIIDINQSKIFADQVLGTTLKVVEGAGHFLFYTHWELMFQEIKKATKM